MKGFTVPFAAVALAMAMPLAAQDVPAVIDGSGTNRIQVVSDFEFSTAVSGSARVVLERTLADEATGGPRTVALTGPNDSSGGMELWGSVDRPLVVTITNVTTMPLSGGIDICTNASLRLAASSSNGKPVSGSRYASTITVHDGGALVQPVNCRYGVLSTRHDIVLDGGVLRLNDGETPTSVAKQLATFYANALTFKNGGRIENGRPYLGHKQNATWTVSGTMPAECPLGASLVGNEAKNKDDVYFNIDVEDVTGDDSTDFSIGVLRRESNSSYQPDAASSSTLTVQSNKVMVVKKGVGTLEFAGANTYYGPTRLDAGTLRLGVTKCLDYSYMLNMNGGSLVACANTTNVIKKLKVSRDGGIALEGGALLTVNAIDSWSSGKTITVDVPNGAKRLRFASKTGVPVVLSEAQLGAIRTVDGRRVLQDEEGWILPHITGAILIVM